MTLNLVVHEVRFVRGEKFLFDRVHCNLALFSLYVPLLSHDGPVWSSRPMLKWKINDMTNVLIENNVACPSSIWTVWCHWVWQSVEEAECRRAYDSAVEVYTSSFDRTKPAEEVRISSNGIEYLIHFVMLY